MSIRNFAPHVLLALLTLPSCATETDNGGSTHEADADTTDDSKPIENGRDGGSKDDSDDDSSDDSDDRSDDSDDSDDSTNEADASHVANESDDTNQPDAADDSNAAEQDGGTVVPDESDVSEPEADAGNAPDETDDTEATSYFLPTSEPDNTVAPRIEIDAQGGIHNVYPAYAGGGAYYSYCAENCDSTDAFKVVRLPSDGTVANAMLALTSDGKPRVLLSMFYKTAFATCEDDCTNEDNWTIGEILDDSGAGAIQKEITGEALALDPEGNPHFISHTYRAYLGIGQQEQLTHHHACYAGDCTVASSWTTAEIATQTWEESQLEFDAEGNAHLAFVAIVQNENEPTTRIAAYANCTGDCDTADAWVSTGLVSAYTDDLEAFSLTSSIALALTKQGKPRLITLGKSSEGEKNLTYFECDANCTGDGAGWVGSMLSYSPDVNVGLDLALDAQDRPRFVHTLNYNISLAWCDTLPCTDPDSEWNLDWVEVSGDIPKDDIILFPNCTVAAWFLHSPSLVLDADGNPYVGYQARDISGGVSNPDPLEQDCVAGTDMTLTRMTHMVF